MKRRYSSRKITFFYFSIIAIALATIHWSVFEFTTEDLERLYAKNRLERIKNYAAHYLNKHPEGNLKKMVLFSISSDEVENEEEANAESLSQNIELYFDFSAIPGHFPRPQDIAYDELVELEFTPEDDQSYFVIKTTLHLTKRSLDVYFVIDNNLFELSEEQLLSVHSKQILITLLLIVISLLVIIYISTILTKPIKQLAQLLEKRSSDNLAPISLERIATTELATLIQTFNSYQERIKDMLVRERSFNRFASHELRSPLMVMTGAVNIMEASDDPEVIAKQIGRLKKTTREMSEFVETLLTLSKVDAPEYISPRQLNEQEITNIISTHEHLLRGKPVSWRLNMIDLPNISIPEFALHILLGNVVKNAFAYTQSGEVVITVNKNSIQVTDTGSGLTKTQDRESNEGYGLGLLLVRDICHRYQWEFSINDNQDVGCNVMIKVC